jgi:beta-galactosidase
MKTAIIGLLILIILSSCNEPVLKRIQMSLNGEWQITKTDSFSILPSTFTSKIIVPGLVDLAEPPIESNRDFDNGIYWHKTNFTIKEEFPELVKLQIGKAKYHAKIYLNQKFVGEHVYCFTSATFDIRKFLNPPGEENELLIGIGTHNNMPDSVMWGQDFEKLIYIPGIYDDVKLILSDFHTFRIFRRCQLLMKKKFVL